MFPVIYLADCLGGKRLKIFSIFLVCLLFCLPPVIFLNSLNVTPGDICVIECDAQGNNANRLPVSITP